jgi:hypothetical protein
VAPNAWISPDQYVETGSDRYALTERQRWAVGRAACTDDQRTQRAATLLLPSNLEGQPVSIDGFNLLITLETALSGGVVLRGRDGVLRDLSMALIAQCRKPTESYN